MLARARSGVSKAEAMQGGLSAKRLGRTVQLSGHCGEWHEARAKRRVDEVDS